MRVLGHPVIQCRQAALQTGIAMLHFGQKLGPTGIAVGKFLNPLSLQHHGRPRRRTAQLFQQRPTNIVVKRRHGLTQNISQPLQQSPINLAAIVFDQVQIAGRNFRTPGHLALPQPKGNARRAQSGSGQGRRGHWHVLCKGIYKMDRN